MPDYLADKGDRILANGYDLIPIQPGTKHPSVKGWSEKLTTKSDLAGWKANGRGSHGCGVKTDRNPLVDLDIYEVGMNRHMVAFVQDTIGFGAIRIGFRPKCGMLFRSPIPFKKITSREFVDPQGRKAQVEILGEGQQFVAYAIHPDTHRPYVWTDAKENPEFTPASELTEITQAQGFAVIAEFERKCEELGWPLKDRDASLPPSSRPQPATGTSVARVAATAPATDLDDPFDIDRHPLGLTDEELSDLVKLIPNKGVKYEGEGRTWLNIMCAIHHESGGSDAGYAIAREFSDRYEDVEEPGRFDKTWNSFGKGKQHPVTARLLVKLAKEYRATTIADALAAAKTKNDLQAVAETISKIEKLPGLEREEYAVAVKEAGTRILGHSLSIKIAREMIRPPRPADLAHLIHEG